MTRTLVISFLKIKEVFPLPYHVLATSERPGGGCDTQAQAKRKSCGRRDAEKLRQQRLCRRRTNAQQRFSHHHEPTLLEDT